MRPATIQYPMPRGGAYVVSDLLADRLCRIACQRCGRSGAYRHDTLASRFGDAALPDVLIAVTACERRCDFSRSCGAVYSEPLGAALRGIQWDFRRHR